MDFFSSTLIPIPLYQIGLMLLISTLSLFFGKLRLALLVNYVFTLYWGYFINREMLLGQGLEKLDIFLAAYFVFGLLVAFLAAAGFLISSPGK